MRRSEKEREVTRNYESIVLTVSVKIYGFIITGNNKRLDFPRKKNDLGVTFETKLLRQAQPYREID